MILPLLSRVVPRTLLLKFANSYEMNMMMLRLQEFYESPAFMGQVFSLEQYMDWYAYNEHRRHRGRPLELGFDYLTRVLGCNVPDDAIEAFFSLYEEDHLTERERWLCATIARFAESIGGGPYYLIATYTNDKEDLQHEVAHARFYLEGWYSIVALHVLERNPCPQLFAAIKNRGYSDEHLFDEAHAYALTGWPKWFPWYRRPPSAARLRKALRKELPIFNKFPLDFESPNEAP